MKIGPNAQAVVDGIKGRPSSVIAAQVDEVQAVFRALFSGAQSPGLTDAKGKLEAYHPDANKGWPGCWMVLHELGLITFALKPRPGKSVMVDMPLNAWSTVMWTITAKGWTVRMDDVAWMVEFQAATEADKATKQ